MKELGKQVGPEFVAGTNAHAEQVTEGRHPGVASALLWLTYAHLPESLQAFSRPFYLAALTLIENIPTDSPELTTALNKLIEAKDSAVRAGIRHQQGRAGSIPRPQAVGAPPAHRTFTKDAIIERAGWAKPADEG